MKIEVGKRYINAKGDIVKISQQHNTIIYPYTCGDFSYTECGKRIKGRETPYDLICEVVPEILDLYYVNPFISKTAIAQREFIERHIKYWTKNEQTDL